ncbi:MAG TPA: flagellar basal-body rod protein FlgF [Burkholderiales bacterium]|nr:flagellar basal-body rod protein FlgF [Burkholderiales bacterium]
MDRLIYTAMTGAKHLLEQQAVVAHNLANVNSTGFRAELSAFRAVPVVGDGANTRAFVVDSTVGADLTPGVLQQTGRPLDVAIQGAGFIAVQAPDGTEAYTRAGDLQVGTNGQLETRSGSAVLGDGGPIAIPPDSTITIAQDGTVSVVPTFGIPNATAIVGRIKLVNPAENEIVRGGDGLFRTRSGNPAEPDANVALASGTLEGSNVNVVDAMVRLIENARQFDMQMKMLQSAESNSAQATSVLTAR